MPSMERANEPMSIAHTSSRRATILLIQKNIIVCVRLGLEFSDECFKDSAQWPASEYHFRQLITPEGMEENRTTTSFKEKLV